MARRHGSISGHAGCVPVEFDSDLFLIKVGPLERDYLGASAPERFLRTEHRSEAEDSVLVRLSATRHEDLDEIAELLDAAWERIASPKILRDAGRAR
jgi:hypothetical protein